MQQVEKSHDIVQSRMSLRCSKENVITFSVILLPAHPASFAHKFLFQRVLECNSIADLSLKIVFRTHKFAVGTH